MTKEELPNRQHVKLILPDVSSRTQVFWNFFLLQMRGSAVMKECSVRTRRKTRRVFFILEWDLNIFQYLWPQVTGPHINHDVYIEPFIVLLQP